MENQSIKNHGKEVKSVLRLSLLFPLIGFALAFIIFYGRGFFHNFFKIDFLLIKIIELFCIILVLSAGALGGHLLYGMLFDKPKYSDKDSISEKKKSKIQDKSNTENIRRDTIVEILFFIPIIIGVFASCFGFFSEFDLWEYFLEAKSLSGSLLILIVFLFFIFGGALGGIIFDLVVFGIYDLLTKSNKDQYLRPSNISTSSNTTGYFPAISIRKPPVCPRSECV